MGRKTWSFVVFLTSLLLLSACAPQPKGSESQALSNDIHSAQVAQHPAQHPTPPPMVIVPGHASTPTVTPTSSTSPTPTTQTQATTPPANIPSTGPGTAPYGAPPQLTAEEQQLTQKLFMQMNSDRAASGLYPFVWNDTLAGGARLHSWNMFHCGFSHTCPDGVEQCQRIAKEGFAGYSDCGENIGYAGPFPTPWEGTNKIQQSMVNEPPTGWHRIHLFSQTLHRAGVGIYVDPGGFIWFTEDLVS